MSSFRMIIIPYRPAVAPSCNYPFIRFSCHYRFSRHKVLYFYAVLISHAHIPPLPAHRSVVHSVWQLEGFTGFQQECIIPKGIVEIIFNFSEPTAIAAELAGTHYHLPACFINGFNRAPIQLQLPEQQQFFGVRLQPLAVKKIFGAPASEFLDLVVDLYLIDAAFHSLWHQLAEQPGFEQRVTIFMQWMEKRWIDWPPQENLLNDFLCSAGQHELSVPTLAQHLCYSPRHLSRKIVEATGMNTEEVLHYKKYLHAVHLMHHTPLSLTDIAYKSQFADQSHFIRSFRYYTQMTPGNYRKHKGFQTGHLYNQVR